MKTYKSFLESLEYKFGDCNIYAIALHRIYNLPLYAVNGYIREDDWKELEEYGDEWGYDIETSHVIVKTNNNKYLDIDGELTEEELLNNCAFSKNPDYIKIEPITEDTAMRLYSDYENVEYYPTLPTKYINEKEEEIKNIILNHENIQLFLK